ncbi:MAG TPA: LuxR C-terminal-related transcriptional regulator [Syntrophales bacterium]|nr:LuxR C-terminal-related transcriptional regulator [Syntrophales bacterium]
MSESRFHCVADFSIDGRHYVIGKLGNGAARPAGDGNGIRPVKSKPVGELKIGGDRYVVFEADGEGHSEWNREILELLKALTEREQQIVSRAALGEANRQIADELHISSHTVSSYLRRIFLKLGVGNRTEMVFKCRKLIENQRSMNL